VGERKPVMAVEIVLEIQDRMSAEGDAADWSPELLDDIALLLVENGYPIKGFGPKDAETVKNRKNRDG